MVASGSGVGADEPVVDVLGHGQAVELHVLQFALEALGLVRYYSKDSIPSHTLYVECALSQHEGT